MRTHVICCLLACFLVSSSMWAQGLGPSSEPRTSSLPDAGDVVRSTIRPMLYFNPPEATDNDRVQVLVVSEPNVCGPYQPVFVGIEKREALIEVHVNVWSGFGGLLGTEPVDDSKCSPAVSFLHALPVDLGTLRPGTYRVALYITQPDYQTDGRTFLAALRDLHVEDAEDVVRLHEDRFSLRVIWTDSAGDSGAGRPIPGPSSSATLFSFFDDDNWEILVKVLDGCAINGHYWVFGAAATDVEYEIEITDTVTDLVWTYINPLGTRSEAIAEVQAFPCVP